MIPEENFEDDLPEEFKEQNRPEEEDIILWVRTKYPGDEELTALMWLMWDLGKTD